MQVFGKVYILITVVLFLVLMLNLIIAILSNTFNQYESLSTGLFLTKILSTRDQFESDEYYGAFISGLVPFNIIVIPFAPIAFFMKKSQKLKMLN